MKKRGNTAITETTIFIALNIMFFLIMLYFVSNSSKGATLYEQIYAKEIALAIDAAQANTTISIGLDRISNLIKENKLDSNKIVRIDNTNKFVVVRLGNSLGYKFNYFSNYPIEVKVEGDRLRIFVNNE